MLFLFIKICYSSRQQSEFSSTEKLTMTALEQNMWNEFAILHRRVRYNTSRTIEERRNNQYVFSKIGPWTDVRNAFVVLKKLSIQRCMLLCSVTKMREELTTTFLDKTGTSLRWYVL